MRPITEAEIIAGLEAIASQEWGAPQPIITATKPSTVRPQMEKIEDLERDWLHIATGWRAPGEPSMKSILVAISSRMNVKVSELRSPRRSRNLVRARMIYYYLCKHLTSYSLPQIGGFVGGKDHSTVMHGLRRVAANPDEFQPELGELLQAFEKAKIP